MATGSVTIWIPLSQLREDVPDVGDWIETIAIPEWLATELGLEYE